MKRGRSFAVPASFGVLLVTSVEVASVRKTGQAQANKHDHVDVWWRRKTQGEHQQKSRQQSETDVADRQTALRLVTAIAQDEPLAEREYQNRIDPNQGEAINEQGSPPVFMIGAI